MDSRIVNREIRREIRPALRQAGFDAFTARTAWRHFEDRVWVVNFQSFNSYFALVDGCTTFSFAVNLGLYFVGLEDQGDGSALIKPKDYQCHFRGKLSKRIIQANYARKDIWYVEPDGSNLLEVLDDARQILLHEGLPWFNRFSDLASMLDTLIYVDEDESLFGIGAKWSPQRKLLIGRAATATGNEELGLRVLREAESEMRSIRLQVESLSRNKRTPERRSER